MATVTFGNFPVNMDDPNVLNDILGNLFDGDPIGTGVVNTSEIQFFFPNGGVAEFDGTFSFGSSALLFASPLTGVQFLDPNFANLLSLTQITGQTLGSFDQIIQNPNEAVFDNWIDANVHTVISGNFNDTLEATDGGTLLEANGGDDILNGGAGNDTLDGGPGADQMSGGPGNDTYIVDNPDDTVTEGTNAGIDTVKSAVSFVLGPNVEKLTLASGAGDINGTGNELSNVITGNEGNNVLSGGGLNDTLIGGAGAGNDTLDGGTGADNMSGGAGDDTYFVDNIGDVVTEGPNAGTDTVNSSVSYTLGANVENLTLTGTANINGTGNALNNVITGNSGNNVLKGGTGIDTMIGGDGNDTYVVDNASELPLIVENANQGTDTLNITYAATPATALIDLTSTVSLQNVENVTIQGAGAFNVTGNALDNVLIGNASINTLTGGEGNDTLNGGAGADPMIGGVGNDTYVVDNVGDVVTESIAGAPGGVDLVQSSISYSLVPDPNVENLTLTGVGSINGTGNGLDNVITGNAGANVLDGGAGADTLIGGGGNDTYMVDEPGDTVTEGTNAGIDTVKSAVSFVLGPNVEKLTLASGAGDINGTGNELSNVITGNEGNNVLSGGGLNDTLIGGAGAGNDTLDGGTGADNMSGGAGDDTYFVDNIGDVVTEGPNAGTDTVNSSVSYTLGANVENLTLTGTANINGTGNALNNVITGNSGNNVLKGGTGIDTMIGGDGNDTYVVDNASELPLIVENANQGTDTLNITYAATPATALIDLTSTVSLQNVENVTIQGAGAFNVTGNALDNVLIGNASINTLTGGEGNDTLNGGAGADPMIGGVGNDTYVVDNVGDVVTESIAGAPGGVDLVQSSISYSLVPDPNVENLTLTGVGSINGTGNGLDNVITGNAGANVLDGGAGADTLIGGGGNDTYMVDEPGDTVTEGTNAGIDTVKSAVSFVLGPNVEKLTLASGAGDINGTGNELSNVITGNEGNNVLSGGGLNDTLIGGAGAGNDTLDGGTGADNMSGGAGDDTYFVDNIGDVVTEGPNAGTDTVNSSVSYTLGANVENLTLTGTANINGTGNALNNVITGNSGNNVLKGGTGIDTMIGGDGNDTYVVDNASELPLIVENANQGTDTLNITYAATPATALIDLTSTVSLQNVENVTIQGAGAFNVTGNALDNTIAGNASNNVLDGGAGNDALIGGAGNDTFIFDPADTTSVQGGTGTDTLKFTGAGQSLDLTNKVGTIYTGLEAIDLTGSGDNSLTLSAPNVFQLSDTHQLTVNGNIGDMITSTGQGWVQGADQTLGGILYHNYTHAGATLHIDADLTAIIS